jgi:DNA-binding response OmpR family regulator
MTTRVLLVEDEVLVALDIAQQIAEAGFEVIGPATSVAKAVALIAERGCDLAVLDVNLGHETAEPIAERLRARGTPFVVLTAIRPSSCRLVSTEPQSCRNPHFRLFYWPPCSSLA